MPGASQFLGHCEQNSAHMRLVRLGTVEQYSRKLDGAKGGLLSVASGLGSKAASGGLPQGSRPGQLLSVVFPCGSLLFLSPRVASLPFALDSTLSPGDPAPGPSLASLCLLTCNPLDLVMLSSGWLPVTYCLD